MGKGRKEGGRQGGREAGREEGFRREKTRIRDLHQVIMYPYPVH